MNTVSVNLEKQDAALPSRRDDTVRIASEPQGHPGGNPPSVIVGDQGKSVFSERVLKALADMQTGNRGGGLRRSLSEFQQLTESRPASVSLDKAQLAGPGISAKALAAYHGD